MDGDFVLHEIWRRKGFSPRRALYCLAIGVYLYFLTQPEFPGVLADAHLEPVDSLEDK